MIGLSCSWIAPVSRPYKSSRTRNLNFTHITIVRSFILHISYFIFHISYFIFHISYERTLIDSLQKLYKDNKADRDSCDFWNRWTRERFIEHLERIWPQTVSVADKTFIEAIRDLYVQYNTSDATT